ncbi:MAG: hypothetical protein QY323_04400 [Patescibacteria group bacterium]|nr:MAG: hypothetical protein QY323_04400 [Patescibacteria group bacterium]
MSDARQGREPLSVTFVHVSLVLILACVMAILTIMLLIHSDDSSSETKYKKRTTEEQNVTAIHEAGHALLSVAVMPERPLEDILVYVEYDEANGTLGLTHAGQAPAVYLLYPEELTKADAMYYLGGAAAEEAVFGTKPQQDYSDKDMVGDELLKYCGNGDGSQCGACPESDLIGETCMVKGHIVSYREQLYAETLAIAKLNRETLAQLANLLMQQPVRGRERKLNHAQLKEFFEQHPVVMPSGTVLPEVLHP